MEKKAARLQVGDVLVNKVLNAKPTRIAEVDLSPLNYKVTNVIMIRFACEEDWYLLHANRVVTVL